MVTMSALPSTFYLSMNRVMLMLLIVLPWRANCQNVSKKQPPNIIFILTDQWRASALGYAGDPNVKTPHLDRLAKDAINFKNAVSVTPVCTPHRAALLTGKYPTTTGMFLNDIYLPAEELCMAEIFKANGYKTGYIGKWHLDGHGRNSYVAPERRQGFDYWKGSECDHNYNKEHYYSHSDTTIQYWQGYSTHAIANDAQDYLAKHAKTTEPFLLFVSMATPHFPHESAPNAYKELYTPDRIKLNANVPENQKERVLKEIQGYYAHCSATDKAIGDIIAKAKQLGIYDNTIIVFTADHGEMMGAHGKNPFMKQIVYAESSEVPFLITVPGIGNNKGKIAEAPITTPDILPTLLSLCTIDIPASIEGYDLSAVVKNPSLQKDKAALFMNICPFGGPWSSTEFMAIKTARYTYSKTPAGADMLFDNNKDPLQLNNLVHNDSHKELLQQLDRLLIREMKRIGVDAVRPRDYYLRQFGFIGLPEFRSDYAVKDYYNVTRVISPELQRD